MGHVSMADPFDKTLSDAIHKAIGKPGTLDGQDLVVHNGVNVICIGRFSQLFL